MAAKEVGYGCTVASHLVKVDPETAGWWISLAYALRRTESVEKAEAICSGPSSRSSSGGPIYHPGPSVAGALRTALERLQRVVDREAARLFGSAGIP